MSEHRLSLSRWELGFIVRVEGRGTMQDSGVFRETVSLFLDRFPRRNVIVDLSDCHYLDSTFMGAMLWLHKHAGEMRSDRLQFCADTSKCRQLFSHTLLDRVLNIIPTCPPITSDGPELAITEAPTDEDVCRLARS